MTPIYSGKVAVCSRTFSKHPGLRELMALKFSNISYNDEGLGLKGDGLVEFLAEVDGAIVALEPVDESVLSRLPGLKVLSKYGVGLDNIDQNLLNKYDVRLGWTGGVNKRSVSELALGFMLSLCRNLYGHRRLLENGQWQNLGGGELSGRTIGIIGMGHIGKDMAMLLRPFNCRILINDLESRREFAQENGMIEASKEEIYKQCDVISLHVPLTSETENLIAWNEFSQMKENAIVINTSRGKVVNEHDLYNALVEGKIAGAGIDVFAEEPQTDSKLFTLNNFIGTPHLGGSTSESIMAMGTVAIDNLYDQLLAR